MNWYVKTPWHERMDVARSETSLLYGSRPGVRAWTWFQWRLIIDCDSLTEKHWSTEGKLGNEGREEGRECSLFCTRRLRLISQTKYWLIVSNGTKLSNYGWRDFKFIKTDVNTCIMWIYIIIFIFTRSNGADQLVSLSGSRKAEYQSRVIRGWILNSVSEFLKALC